jgi:hypothetical protein
MVGVSDGAAKETGGAMRFLALGLVAIAVGWPTVSYSEA